MVVQAIIISVFIDSFYILVGWSKKKEFWDHLKGSHPKNL